ncbi:hypothetical protein MauCBS54593_007868 [Microsporum audouinii]
MAQGTIIVTGANGALGSAIVREIIDSPSYSSIYYGLYTVRDLSSASSLRAGLQQTSGAGHQHHSDVIQLDLSKLASVRAAAASINSRVRSRSIPPIRALILNAGFQESITQMMTEDGFDMSFQVNYLGHFLLSLLLLESMDKHEGRILCIGSWTHDPDDTRNFPALYPEQYRPILRDGVEPLAHGTWSTPAQDPSPLSGIRRYGASKLCVIIMIYELQRRLDCDPALSNINILGLDPGGMPSGIMRRASFLQGFIINKVAGTLLAPIMTWFWPNGILRTPAKSAHDALEAVFGDEETLGGPLKALYLDGSEVSMTSEEARDSRNAAMLWRASLAYAGLGQSETCLADSQ